MTTVVTDGKYMIADRRVSQTISIRARCGKHSNTSEHRARVDTAIKLIAPQNLIYKGVGVKCMGFAGSESYLELMHRITRSPRDSIEFDTVLQTLHLFEVGTSVTSTGTFLVILENGKVCKCNITPRNSRLQVAWTEIPFETSDFVMIGSGAGVWKQFDALIDADVPMLEAFLFCAHIDPSSTENYSVYSVADHEIFTDVRPGMAEIMNAVDSVRKKVKFFDHTRKPMAIPIMDT